jgi:hypothetical protein
LGRHIFVVDVAFAAKKGWKQGKRQESGNKRNVKKMLRRKSLRGRTDEGKETMGCIFVTRYYIGMNEFFLSKIQLIFLDLLAAKTKTQFGNDFVL